RVVGFFCISDTVLPLLAVAVLFFEISTWRSDWQSERHVLTVRTPRTGSPNATYWQSERQVLNSELASCVVGRGFLVSYLHLFVCK
ncbi:MAG: hypothetical protein VZQ78_09375, partial [Prevotella sp.]|nr:hypothetical protein [Prevotella sp.]